MNKTLKIFGLVAITSFTLSACSRVGNPLSQSGSGATSATGASQISRSGSSQVSRSDSSQSSGERRGIFSQQRRQAAAPAVVQPVITPKPTYTYTPPPTPVYRPPVVKPVVQAPVVRPAPVVRAPVVQQQPVQIASNGRSQQWYIDRWNRQQQYQQKQQQQPAATTSTYSGSNTNTSNTTYYDYSTAGKGTYDPAPVTRKPVPAAPVATSNKSIYTGSYQQPAASTTYKPYQPNTYTGGNTSSPALAPVSSSVSSSYVVKKGDTVFEVMRQTGVYWKDIISLNKLQPPYTIQPGQRLRLK